MGNVLCLSLSLSLSLKLSLNLSSKYTSETCVSTRNHRKANPEPDKFDHKIDRMDGYVLSPVGGWYIDRHSLITLITLWIGILAM